MVTAFGLVFLGLSCTPVGEGADALAGFRQSSVVLVALEDYRRVEGSYPDSLAQLVPQLLQASSLSIQYGDSDSELLWYERTEVGYDLMFTYYGPGGNQCTFSRPESEWSCTGYF